MNVKNKQTNIFQEAKSEVWMAKEYVKSNVASAAELRVSFLMQVVGMMLNNTAFLIVWVLFFKAFGNINGWSANEVLALQGFSAITYGLTFSLFSGVVELAQVVYTGALDSILLTPRNLYLRVLTLVTRTSAVGDCLFGLILIVTYCFTANLDIFQIVLLFVMIVPTTLILTNFALITSCIGFFVPDSVDISKYVFEMMFGPSMYPSGVYQGTMRFIFLFILPSIAIAGLPVEALKDFSIPNILLVFVLAIVWTMLGVFILKFSVRNYESGNLTGARI